MEKMADITDRIDLVDFRSEPSNKAFIGRDMSSNYVYNRKADGTEVILPDYFMDYPDEVLSEAVFNVIKMENDRKLLATDYITQDLLTMRNRLYEIRTTKKLRYT